MKLLDVSVVLAAHRDDHPQFPIARPWVEQLLAAGEQFTVPDLVTGSFLRLATNRRVFTVPTPLGDAFAFLRALRAQPSHLAVGPGPRHLDLLESQCEAADAVGDLVPDARLAALALEHAAEIVSFDRDFARFDDIRWRRPGA